MVAAGSTSIGMRYKKVQHNLQPRMLAKCLEDICIFFYLWIWSSRMCCLSFGFWHSDIGPQPSGMYCSAWPRLCLLGNGPSGKAVCGNSDMRREKRRPISLAQAFEEKRNNVPTYSASCWSKFSDGRTDDGSPAKRGRKVTGKPLVCGDMGNLQCFSQ